MIEILQKILDRKTKLTIARFNNIIQVLLVTIIDGKECWYRINVKKIEEFFNKEFLNKILVMISEKRIVNEVENG